MPAQGCTMESHFRTDCRSHLDLDTPPVIVYAGPRFVRVLSWEYPAQALVPAPFFVPLVASTDSAVVVSASLMVCGGHGEHGP